MSLVVPFAVGEGRLGSLQKALLSLTVSQHFPLTPTHFRKAEPGPGVVGFGVPSGITTLSPKTMLTRPFAERYLAVALHKVAGWPALVPGAFAAHKVLYFDIESHGVQHRWSLPPQEFFRLGQYAWGPTGKVVLTPDYHEMIEMIRAADLVVGHNIHAFDLSVLFGMDSTEPLEMARDGRVFDTMVYAATNLPAPDQYVDRKGRQRIHASKPENALMWLGLDNLCYQLGLEGKEGDLRELAKRYNPPGTPVGALDYSLIPLDDPDFRAYATQDVVALQEATTALLIAKKPTDYDWREQVNAGIDAQNSRNGFRVDIEAATARRDQLAQRRAEIVAQLEADYGFPTTGAMPWRSNPGKAAILKALADAGVTPETRPDWQRTKTGNISLGGEAVVEVTEGTEAEELGRTLAEVMGQRTLAQLALECTQPDGKVHPEITALQRSGRKSTTKPGLTVWTSRGKGAVEKAYFIADSPDEALVAFDFSQADARIVAALSGDVEFKKRFAPGVDAHALTGRLVFGDVVYDSDPTKYRQVAKGLGHAYAYRAGPRKLAMTAKQPLEVAEAFVSAMAKAYPDVTAWQDMVTAEGENGFVCNPWGRVMVVEADRSYTQSPALYGQSGTREIMVDALIRMLHYDIRLITWIKAQVHDELIFSIPKSEIDWAIPKIEELMTCEWGPDDGIGQVVDFPVSAGKPARTWEEATH